MDNTTKLLTSRASLELHYMNGKSTLAAYREVDAEIENLYQQNRITRREMTELKRVNAELYEEFHR